MMNHSKSKTFSSCYEGCNSTLAIVILCYSVAINGAILSGYNLNALELSPNYSGTLRGAISTIAQMAGFISPAVVGVFTEENVNI